MKQALLSLLAFVLALPVAGYVALGASAYARQDEMLFPAERGPMDVAQSGVAGMRAVTLRTGDGLSLVAWYKPAPAGAPTIMYFHGNGGNIADRAVRMQLFDRLGWGELFVEYRGYGPNGGTPSQAGFYKDAEAGYAFLQEQAVPVGRIVLYGESLGTGVAVHLAAERPVAAVILDSPYTSIADVAQAHFWYLPAALLIRNPFPLRALIGKIHAPLLVMQGALDDVVPPAQGQADFEAAAEPKQFWQGPDSLHWNVLETGGAAVVKSFIARMVPNA